MSKRITPHGVVVGADGSPSSRVAVRWAAREAAMRHISLTVVHVAASLPVAASTLAWPAGRVPEEVLEIEENEARRVIADAIKVAEDSAVGSDRPEIDSEQFFGGPVSTLVDLSKETQLVVVGCHGRTGQHRRLLGSVSTGLIHHAHCPVAVIHNEAPSSLQSAQLPVLVGIDGSRASELATAIAFDEASWRGVDLVALHVWSDADMSSDVGMEESALQSAAKRRLPNAWPAGRNAIPRSRSTYWSTSSSRPAIFSTSPRGPSSSSSVATVAADSPGCCSVQSAPPWRRRPACRSSLRASTSAKALSGRVIGGKTWTTVFRSERSPGSP